MDLVVGYWDLLVVEWDFMLIEWEFSRNFRKGYGICMECWGIHPPVISQ